MQISRQSEGRVGNNLYETNMPVYDTFSKYVSITKTAGNPSIDRIFMFRRPRSVRGNAAAAAVP